MNTKTDSQVKQEQEKTDKIQDFLNKQFSEITIKAKESQGMVSMSGGPQTMASTDLFGGKF